MDTITEAYIATLTEAGFRPTVIGTGGNCEAIQINAGNGAEVLITDDAQLPDEADYCCVGLRTEDDDPIYIDADLATVADAVRVLVASVG
jgi:hypothetical protein